MEHQINNKTRIWELDLLRGIALILMIYFHIIYDLKEFYDFPISYENGVNFYIGKISVILFMLISGISSSLSKSNIKRAFKVLGIALIITIATHLYDPDYGIKFGILHFLGVSMLLSPVFSKLNKYILLLLGTLTIIVGNAISNIETSVNYLFPLGIINSSFVSSDYYPLVPWFGIFLYGIALGKFLYTQKRSLFTFSLKDNVISNIGQKTLPLYLMHQPTIIITIIILRYLMQLDMNAVFIKTSYFIDMVM